MATTEEDLAQLEKDIRQLKIEYEQYFGGGRKRPPSDIEWRIEQLIKRYGERTAHMNFAQRFRFSGLAQKHAKFRDIYRKRLKEKEEGTVSRHFGAAAKAIEAERAARKTRVMDSLNAEETTKGKRRTTAKSSHEDRPESADQPASAAGLYEVFRSAKEKAGENTAGLTPQAFQEFVRRKTKELQEQSGDDNVEFVVATEGGRVRLKARVSSPAKTHH